MSDPITPSPQYYGTDDRGPPLTSPEICSMIGLGLGFTVAPLLIGVGMDTDNTPVLAAGVAIAIIGGLSLLFITYRITYQVCKPDTTGEGTALLATRVNQLPRDSQGRAAVPRDEPLQSHELV